jgi:hypothetical protein
MTTEGLLLLVLIVLVLGSLPAWPYSSSWGYGPTGGLTLILVIILVVALMQGRPLFRSTTSDAKATAQDAGHDLQNAGRDAASTLRNAVGQ